MQKVADLRAGWEHEKAAEKAASEKKAKRNKVAEAPDADDALFPEVEGDEPAAPATNTNLFDDSDDDSDAENEPDSKGGDEKAMESEEKPEKPAAETTQQDLFGDSSDEDEESDEEL